MKRALLTALVAVAACAPPYSEPTPFEREVPGLGDAPRPQAPEYVPDAGEFSFPDAGCCPVRFALASQGEAAVALFGFTAPLQPDVPMTRDGGAWETTVCMPRSTQLYGYRLFIETAADAGLFELSAVNPNAPTVRSSEFGLLNEFRADDAGTCGDVDTAPHGDATVPDAGP
jgi:hypothetical protein